MILPHSVSKAGRTDAMSYNLQLQRFKIAWQKTKYNYSWEMTMGTTKKKYLICRNCVVRQIGKFNCNFGRPF